MNIIDWLKLPEVKNIEGKDDASKTLLHAKIIWRKLFLRKLYTDFYAEFKNIINASGGRLLVELGSGGGFIKNVMPDIKTSDVVLLPNIDLNLSADNMPFKDASVDGFFLLDVLHHIGEPFSFLKEAERCLKIGGKIVMIEPANTIWGRFIYKNFHHEAFNPLAGWSLKNGENGFMANGALPWIIFIRDNTEFAREFPGLKIKKLRFHTPLRYLISGGVSMRQLLPSFSYSLIKAIEFILAPLNRYIGMFSTIEIQKVI